MTLLARKMIFVANIVRIVSAAVALAAMLYGIYLAANGAYVTGGTWIAGAAFFGFAAYMLIGLVALLIGGVGAPAVRRQ